tara:strand:+ start:92 stop:1297 length:1206 start_codon:yes stop_codon:yes gene_type:complete
MSLEINYINTDVLIPYVNNSRTHSDKQVTEIASSIKEFGFTNPVLIDKENTIIAGHGRLLASKKLGLKEVPTILLENLTEAQKKAYIIADNKLALNAGWDEELLSIELKELDELGYNTSLTGFSDDELSDILDKPITKGLTDEDEVPEDVEPIVEKGDIWQLGNHRLMCGDSTFIDNIDLVTKKETINMVFTDPPYNALKSWKKNEAKSETRLNPNNWFSNDNMNWEDYQKFLLDSFSHYSADSIYICCDYRIYPLLTDIIKKINYKLKHCIVWKKNVWGLGKRYRFQHEFIIYATKKDNAKFYGDNSQSDVWEINVDRSKEHKTPKPVELVVKAIINSTKSKNIVFDSFLGSGTTLIACEKTNRICYGMELSPKYCDVIIKRWENFTGKKAERIDNGLSN